MPDVNLISTSHVEKQNHTLRMHCRRLTRLTNAFSKKFENFSAAVSLNFAYYNLVKTHGAIRMTPAQAGALKQAHGRLPNWLNAAVNKADYIARFQVAVSQLNNCGAVWHETVPVHEVFHGKTVWQGDVEVFDLHNHPKAKRAYAWSHLDGPKDKRERFVAVLEIPPVDSAQKAVQVQIVKDVRMAQK